MTKSARPNAQGNFEFDNVPYNNYHLSATAPGFQGGEQDVNVRSPLPVEMKITVQIGAANESVTVTDRRGSGRNRSFDPYRRGPGPFRQAASRKRFFFAQFSGHAGDAGSLRPTRTACFTDWAITLRTPSRSTASRSPTSKARSFQTRSRVDAVQSMEVIEGAPPAEYGGKTSLVIVVTTRSGWEQPRPTAM